VKRVLVVERGDLNALRRIVAYAEVADYTLETIRDLSTSSERARRRADLRRAKAVLHQEGH